ncbi:hypothetical protein KBY83_12635 [Cyanobium sp. WKJ7-Wakatipu]|uniref:hypothetical protein n=1 Tax=Cyanobium sp. WKJ7-Wakatipu TaxID=2823726 RepID=UPI0020CD8DDC|nr:hypothetical protein [Cyanobium sp. WKJ7-Wakatipu]MCP9784147.1 hypothetical protein [Cyanobium sp. WKJ7-Wakatipu]
MDPMFGNEAEDRALWKEAAKDLLRVSRALDSNQPDEVHRERTCHALVALTPWSEPEWWLADVEEAQRHG